MQQRERGENDRPRYLNNDDRPKLDIGEIKNSERQPNKGHAPAAEIDDAESSGDFLWISFGAVAKRLKQAHWSYPRRDVESYHNRCASEITTYESFTGWFRQAFELPDR